MAKPPTDSAFYTLDIQGMTCASCVGRIERALQKVPDIDKVTVNLATEQARVRVEQVFILARFGNTLNPCDLA